MKISKAEKKLKTVCQQLNDACENLDNAFATLNSTENLPSDVTFFLNRIDLGAIVALKNGIEDLIENKK